MMTTQLLPPARLPRPEDQRPMSATFDRLIDSNLRLTANVGRLVWLLYGVLLTNATLIALLWRHL